MRKPILNLPKNVEIISIVYGFEFYSKMKNINLYKNKTNNILNYINRKKKVKNLSIRNSLREILTNYKTRSIVNKSFKKD